MDGRTDGPQDVSRVHVLAFDAVPGAVPEARALLRRAVEGTSFAGGKTVWFELGPSADARAELDVDALLAAWGDELDEDPALEDVRVVLTGLDVGLTAHAEAHVEALLRELTLLASAGTAPPAQLLTAPAPLELSHARRSYLRRVLAQLGS